MKHCFTTAALAAAIMFPFQSAGAATRTDDVITDPVGTAVTYSRSSYSIAPLGDQPMETEDYGFAGVIVTGDNGDVYLKNPFSQFPTNSYLKGTLTDGKITVELPQHIMTLEDEEEGTFELYAWMLTIDEEAEEMVPADDQTFTLVEDDGMWVCMDESILAMTFDDGYWTGFGEMAMCYAPIESEMAEAPDGAAFEKWAMIYDGIGHFVDMAKVGDICYLKNLLPVTTGELAPAVGSYSEDAIRIPSGQYLGVDEEVSYLTYLYGGTIERYFDEDYNMEMTQFYPEEELVFLRSDDGSYTTESSFYLTPFTDLGNEYKWALASYEKPVIRKNDVTTFRPADPSVLDYVYYPSFGFGYAEFFIPMLNEEEMLLDSSKLYYNFYIDGELVTLSPDEYPLLTEEITDIPYSFTDGTSGEGDIKVNGATHTIMVYREGVESIGVQTLYKAEDGTVFKSALITNEKDGVESVGADARPVAEILTDLFGRNVPEDFKGVCVRTVRYSDGSVMSFKEIRR